MLLAPLALLAASAVCGAQGADDDLAPGRRFLSAYVAGSWSSAIGPAYSSIPTQPYVMAVGRAEYVLEAFGPARLAFYMEAMPVIVVANVPHYHWGTFWLPPEGPMLTQKVWDEPAPVYGAGVTPVGVQLYLKFGARVSAFASASGGAAWFTRDMPVPDARRLNFLADLGTGLRIARSERTAFVVGGKFQHMSNANLGRQNPGIDGNVVYAGLSKTR